MFQFHVTLLSQPLIYLPYVAMELRGIWSALHVRADIQITLLISLTISSEKSQSPVKIIQFSDFMCHSSTFLL